MRGILDLSSYQDVMQHRHVVRRVFELPVSDPNHMPVTRALSPAKRGMVLQWLDEREPLAMEITDLAGLRRIVQLAIEVEHATIPPYLCALFSIKPGRNIEVGRLLRSVVVEEMLHMALMGNLLNALGGEPKIDKPAFVPRYPGHLPASVRPDITVTLRKCSKEQIHDVFMAIEQPENVTLHPGLVDAPPTIDVRPLKVGPGGSVSADDDASVADIVAQVEQRFADVEHTSLTLGWFYAEIARAVIRLEEEGQKIFTGDPALQLAPAHWPGAPGHLYTINDRATALLAIYELIRQGEGTSLSDPTDDRKELAHYFRLQEIVKGQTLVRSDAGQWAFDGQPIIFEPDGVFPMVDDPDTAALPATSAARAASEHFDALYGNLLRSLQQVFNGNPIWLGKAIGLMFSLEIEARKLMTVPIGDGSSATVGPAFQPR
jgi:hypothetical protein